MIADVAPTPRREIRYHWESPAELGEACERERCGITWQGWAGPPDFIARWTGETWSQAVERAKRGRADLVAEAERLMEQISAQVDSPRSQWVASRAGAYPMVPDALCGHPDSMRRRVEVCDDRAPVRVYVDLVSQVSVTHEDLRRRGAACLALAMLLSAERPVELYGVVVNDVTDRASAVVHVIRVGTAPLDLATACNALTSVGLVRDLAYGWSRRHGYNGGWGWSLPPSDEASRAQYVRLLRAALGASESDIIVPPAMDAYRDPAMRDPVGFVQRSLDEHSKREE